MTPVDIAHARSRLSALGLFPDAAVAAAAIAPLFGLTNAVFRVDIAGERLCLRIPGAGTATIVDREREAANARTAARCGVAPEVVRFSRDGVMLTRFVEGGVLSPQRFREDPPAVTRAADALRRLHQCGENFAGVFDVFERIAFYRDLLQRRGVTLAPEWFALLGEAESMRAPLAARPVSLVPCHCDPTGRNLIDGGDRIWLIDWEYSGMNDAAWDLAYLCIEADFDDAQERTLLAAYHRREPYPEETARVGVFKALCQILSALWALVQHSSSNSSADFGAYAEKTFAQATERMRHPAFACCLSILRG
jgi:thiamine kinase-like enzyme